MDLEGIVLGEVSETEKEILYDLSYVWNLKILNSQRQSTVWRLSGAGARGWGKWVKELRKCKFIVFWCIVGVEQVPPFLFFSYGRYSLQQTNRKPQQPLHLYSKLA